MSLSDKAGELEALANGQYVSSAMQALSACEEALTNLATAANGIIGDIPAGAAATQACQAPLEPLKTVAAAINEAKEKLISIAQSVRQAGSGI